MILVIDIGNTHIVFGVYKEQHLLNHWRISTVHDRTEDEYGVLICTLLEKKQIAVDEIKGVIISSVAPSLMFAFEHMAKKYFNQSPMIVGPGIKTGLNILYDNPRDVGADRIVNAVAAIEEYGSPLVIVDFGTATTFCFIDEKGNYVGGAIAPGITISTDALYTHASKLPHIEIAAPQSVVGQNTIQAMQAGIYYGYIGQVDGIVNRMKAQAAKEPKVIATGGPSELIGDSAASIDTVDAFLTLKGLKMIYDKNN
ncbi:type III pantothenate kinase [Salicibibacter halophilus]|uniref:Type III pantothenate kinase n=1 Tax=Salicibibacter halophilus TaxID=2502791 RepID=A0A514LI77_9BACI|nr:type III pantothenate kinase [Salicibibacter halophilus]QDI91539.1 type III pantothenate kinase [Salicibibacter halophilus]